MSQNSPEQSQVHPQGSSALALSLRELPNFWTAQQDYFKTLLSKTESQEIQHPLVNIFVRDSTFANKNVMGFWSCLCVASFLLVEASDADSDFFLAVGYGVLAVSFYFGVKWLHLRFTGQGRGKAAYQKELGRSFFLESFFKQMEPPLSPKTQITGHIDHRSHRAYKRTFALKDILEPKPVEVIEKKAYQQSFPWASLEFTLNDGSPMRLRCFDVVSEAIYTDRKKQETYRFELCGPQIYPNPFVFYVRPPDPAIGKVSEFEPEWVEHSDPQLFVSGKYLGHMLAYHFQRIYLALV